MKNQSCLKVGDTPPFPFFNYYSLPPIFTTYCLLFYYCPLLTCLVLSPIPKLNLSPSASG